MMDYLQAILTPLLTRKEELSIVETHDDRGVLFTVELHKDDMGRVIGRAGSHINKIREMMNLYGFLNQARISVKIVEPKV